jgi:hypothetical protein
MTLIPFLVPSLSVDYKAICFSSFSLEYVNNRFILQFSCNVFCLALERCVKCGVSNVNVRILFWKDFLK